jgi:hypothetical protein
MFFTDKQWKRSMGKNDLVRQAIYGHFGREYIEGMSGHG